jgi:glutamate-ammonia-ligase adenylyltransferase
VSLPFPKFFAADTPTLKPGDLHQAKIGMERWLAHGGDGETAAFSQAIAAAADGAFLTGVFGNSAYLTDCLLKERVFAQTIFEQGPDAAYEENLATLAETQGDASSLNAIMAALRTAKRRTALVAGLADIAEIWDLDAVTAKLSRFADVATNLALRFALRQSAEKGIFTLPEGDAPELTAGFAVLALGKLGAEELNYSSDIDLIAIYDPEKFDTAKPAELGAEPPARTGSGWR